MENNNISSIAQNIIKLRQAKGITQYDVACALSVSDKTVSKWENGASEPNINMIIALSKYFNVSTDTLLGLESTDKTTKQVIADQFKSLDRRETGLKIFEIIKSIFPASYDAGGFGTDNRCMDSDFIPPQTDIFTRYAVSLYEIFNFAVCSDNVNLSVIQWRNKSNFDWINKEDVQNRIIKLLKFLSDRDAIKICAFIHTTTCSLKFTADYIVKNTGVSEEKTLSILDEACEIEICSKFTAHLKSKDATVYESYGDGIILAIISIAYEKMCDSDSYNYFYNGPCKMIEGEKL